VSDGAPSVRVGRGSRVGAVTDAVALIAVSAALGPPSVRPESACVSAVPELPAGASALTGLPAGRLAPRRCRVRVAGGASEPVGPAAGGPDVVASGVPSGSWSCPGVDP